MKTSILCALTLGICATAKAQETQTLISFRHGTVAQVITPPPVTLHDVIVKGVNLDFRAFGGFGFGPDGRLVGGLTSSVRVPVAREVALDLGLYGKWNGRLVDGGLYVGVGFKL